MKTKDLALITIQLFKTGLLYGLTAGLGFLFNTVKEITHNLKVDMYLDPDHVLLRMFKLRKMLYQSTDLKSSFYAFVEKNPQCKADLTEVSAKIREALYLHNPHDQIYTKIDGQTSCLFTDYLDAIEALNSGESEPLADLFQYAQALPLLRVFNRELDRLETINQAFHRAQSLRATF